MPFMKTKDSLPLHVNHAHILVPYLTSILMLCSPPRLVLSNGLLHPRLVIYNYAGISRPSSFILLYSIALNLLSTIICIK
jgi:hypothetical protein